MRNHGNPNQLLEHSGRLSLLVILLVALLSGCRPIDTADFITDLNFNSDILSISTEATPTAPTSAEELERAAAVEEALHTAEEEQFLVIEEIIIGMLFLAVIIGIVAQWLRVPYTVGLVLIGLLLTLYGRVEITISPTLILALLVPPLIFEAAFHLNLRTLRDNLATILVLAIPGVLLTTFIVGGIVSWGTGLALPVALVFGALVAATDPVSVVALFRAMGVPKRLQILLEGESLFNDGTAIVVFDLVLVIALSGLENFNLVTSLLDFFLVAGGGLLVGFVLGAGFSQMISRIDDYLIETTLTSVLAYGAFLVAELLGVSGVLAVVAAGLISGNIGPRGMSPTTRIVVFNFWEYVAFLANSFIFLLIGLRIELTLLFENWQLILWAIGAVLISRAIGVYGLSRLGPRLPLRWQHVMYWGGLRGAISLALALSLPASLAHAEEIRLMAFGVVLFTLLVQGLTMSPLVKRLNLVERSEMQDEYERRHARAVAARAAFEHLSRRNQQGLLSDHIWRTLSPLLAEHNEQLTEAVREVLASDPSVETEELDTTRREALRAQRSAINSLLRDGVIGEETYNQLVAEIDAALTEARIGWPELIGASAYHRYPINRLMTVVIQQYDLENVISALTKLGFTVTRLPSKGAFLNKHNATLLIGLADGHEERLVEALKRSCQRRVEFLDTPIPGIPGVAGEPLQVSIGGATIFVFKLDQFVTF